MNTPRFVRESMAPAQTLTFADWIDQAAQKVRATLSPESIRAFNGRLERALELAKSGAVTAMADADHPRRFRVNSSAAGHPPYEVDLDAKTCTCPDSQKGNACKHRMAAYYVEQASKLRRNAAPQPVQPVNHPPVVAPQSPIARKSVEQLLHDLGFDPDSRQVREAVQTQPAPVSPAPQLGQLYRRYLHGSDLGQQAFKVIITEVTREKVCPHPSQPPVEKYCLWVSGLPNGMANGILFGARGEEDLAAIFGNVELPELKGRQVVVYARPLNVAGQQKLSIRFRGA